MPAETVVTVIPPAAASSSPAAGMPTASAPLTTADGPQTISCRRATTHHGGGAAAGNVLGIAAPAEPTRAKVACSAVWGSVTGPLDQLSAVAIIGGSLSITTG